MCIRDSASIAARYAGCGDVLLFEDEMSGDSAGAFSPIGMYTTEEVIAIGCALGLPERFLRCV